MGGRKSALITGITGQDGAHLARFLIGKDYLVHGLRRHSSVHTGERLESLGLSGHPSLRLHTGDLTDMASLIRVLHLSQPDEVYNLAAQSHVHVSFQVPEYTANVNASGSLRLLESIRTLGMGDKVRFYQASTSELFGNVREVPQSETTPFSPRSPYGTAKLFAHWTTVNYREAYGMFASTGILFNHDSTTRGENFATRKITRGVAAIHLGLKKKLCLGNLESKRDWGHVEDYVEGMWRILQHDSPDDFVLATGVTRSVREFATTAFGVVGIELEWRNSGLHEVALRRNTGEIVVDVSPLNFPPADVDLLVGDASKAANILGWKPRIRFEDTVREMVESDLVKVAAEASAGREI